MPDGIINVPGDYSTIQEAINAASDGDEIVVMPGVYTADSDTSGEAVVDMMGKAITLRSHSSASDTIISGSQTKQCIRCGSGESRDTVIQGFTLIFGGNVYEGGGFFVVQTAARQLLAASLLKALQLMAAESHVATTVAH